jgi:cell wall-associated NlpC family hydrolase
MGGSVIVIDDIRPTGESKLYETTDYYQVRPGDTIKSLSAQWRVQESELRESLYQYDGFEGEDLAPNQIISKIEPVSPQTLANDNESLSHPGKNAGGQTSHGVDDRNKVTGAEIDGWRVKLTRTPSPKDKVFVRVVERRPDGWTEVEVLGRVSNGVLKSDPLSGRHGMVQGMTFPLSPASGTDAELIQRSAEAYMGVPYGWGGDSSRGIDCSHFVAAVLRRYRNTPDAPVFNQEIVGTPIHVNPALFESSGLVRFIGGRKVRGIDLRGFPSSIDNFRTGDRLIIQRNPDTIDRTRHTGVYLGAVYSPYYHHQFVRGVAQASSTQGKVVIVELGAFIARNYKFSLRDAPRNAPRDAHPQRSGRSTP